MCMDEARTAHHASTATRPRHAAASPARGDWADAVRYYHGQGPAPRLRQLSLGFVVVMFLLAMLTALALLEQFG